MKLRNRILFSFLSVIALLSVLTSLLGLFVVNRYIVEEVQGKVNDDLKTVRAVYDQQLEKMAISFILVTPKTNLQDFKRSTGLDYVFYLPKDRLADCPSDIVCRAVESGQAVGGNRLIGKDELHDMGWGFYERALIEVKATPQARPSDQELVETAMGFEYARPFLDERGAVVGVMFGGKILNKNFHFIDDIVNAVFENELYDSKPVGTVTIFLDDVRITTNVLNDQSHRAIGTRVSQIVYDKVMGQGQRWLDRAFVVTDWYRTAYEPIRDIDGRTLGILYVGILEKPFLDLRRNISLGFLAIILSTGILAIFVSFFLAAMISKPLTKFLRAADKFSEGDLNYRIDTHHAVREFDQLVAAFNQMAEKISVREKSLQASKDQVDVLNKRYLDLVGFVSHELKGILSSIVLNTYLLQNKLLGPITDKQEKTLKSIARNLDYLTTTVKNFLNLSRIEKGELSLNVTEVLLKEHVLDVAIEAFQQQAQEKQLTVVNEVTGGVAVKGDSGLLQIVANNLLSNAIKYSRPEGLIKLSSQIKENMVQVEFYNDGKPIADIDIDKLFKKFSRLIYTGMEKVKGTGVGLFITKEIVEKHGGTIRVEPRTAGNSFIFTISLKL